MNVCDSLFMLVQIVEILCVLCGIVYKCDIDVVMQVLLLVFVMQYQGYMLVVGDDCVVILDGDGYLLFVIEGFFNEFVDQQFWFVGYCGVMVNVSDIYVMGGCLLVVVDVLWSCGGEVVWFIFDGLVEGVCIYGVLLVGGYSNCCNDCEQFFVFIIGWVMCLLISFDVCSGEYLVVVIDLCGCFQELYVYWNVSIGVFVECLCGDFDVLFVLVEVGLVCVVKDISMVGVIGIVLMLLECFVKGVVIDLEVILCLFGVDFQCWLSVFFSYGFLLSVVDDDLLEVLVCFVVCGIVVVFIGCIDDSCQLDLCWYEQCLFFWNLVEEVLIGCGLCWED